MISILNMFFLPFLFVIIIIAAVAGVLTSASNQNLSEYVIAWMPQISEACERHGIPEYTALVAAVMMQESGGNAELVDGDVMQCAEGMGYPVGTPVPPEESIDFGVRLIADLLSRASVTSPTDLDRIKLALQAYNYGSGYISYALARDGGYTEENAIAFSDQQAAALGWSGYGDKRYVEHVLRYYTVSSGTGIGGSSSRYPTIMYPMGTLQWTTYTGHEGIDIPCNVGTPIYASASGTVTYTKNNWVSADGVSGLASYGNCVFINHSSGLQTRYAHMQYTVVQSGQSVFQGQLIGYSGNTGNSTGPHLHFSIYDGGSPGGGGYQNNAALAFPDMRMY